MRSATRPIMIVEDEAMIGFDLADLLSDAGYAVSGPWATSDEALDALSRASVSLAILDVNLGEGRTSRGVAERLRNEGTPILFVSGYNASESEVLQAFPDAMRVPKPWDPAELLAVVRRVVMPSTDATSVG